MRTYRSDRICLPWTTLETANGLENDRTLLASNSITRSAAHRRRPENVELPGSQTAVNELRCTKTCRSDRPRFPNRLVTTSYAKFFTPFFSNRDHANAVDDKQCPKI